MNLRATPIDAKSNQNCELYTLRICSSYGYQLSMIILRLQTQDDKLLAFMSKPQSTEHKIPLKCTLKRVVRVSQIKLGCILRVYNTKTEHQVSLPYENGVTVKPISLLIKNLYPDTKTRLETCQILIHLLILNEYIMHAYFTSYNILILRSFQFQPFKKGSSI